MTPPPVRIPPTGPANPSDLPPIFTNPLSGRMFEDWRELVRDTLNSPNISICISTKGTPSESSDNWVSRISPASPSYSLEHRFYPLLPIPLLVHQPSLSRQCKQGQPALRLAHRRLLDFHCYGSQSHLLGHRPLKVTNPHGPHSRQSFGPP